MGFNTIETPGIPGGDENQKIDGLYRYLVRMADAHGVPVPLSVSYYEAMKEIAAGF